MWQWAAQYGIGGIFGLGLLITLIWTKETEVWKNMRFGNNNNNNSSSSKNKKKNHNKLKMGENMNNKNEKIEKDNSIASAPQIIDVKTPVNDILSPNV